MSLSLATAILFTNTETKMIIVKVQSLKCHYRVAIEEEQITLYGPGVEETYDPEELPLFFKLTPEGQAMLAVLLFEEG